MWFDYGGSFWVDDEDFQKMIACHKRGLNIDEAFNCWRMMLLDVDYQNVLYVEDKIKEELRRRLDA